ncbi:MAG: carboxylate--amine ligase [Clostridiales bacterium]|nr:carboxylate--amine ligase [Clostridiales bacterium]
MGKAKYIMRVVSGVRVKKMFAAIDAVHEKSGQNKIYTFFDMLRCAPKYGAGYYDYLHFGFYDLNAAQRETFMTRVKNKKLIMLLNDQSYSHVFSNKAEFDEIFKAYLHRGCLDMSKTDYNTFVKFMEDKEIVFAKPVKGESGKGIERLKKSDFDSLSSMYDYASDEKFGLIEEQIVQHPALSAVYPNAINSYRIVTLVSDGVAHCVYAAAKFGNGGKFVDNISSGGLCCPINIETGKLRGPAHTRTLATPDRHPDSGIVFEGYELPYVKEAVDMCLKAALEVEQIKYVGWDVFVAPDGPGIIEGNDYPGCYDFCQLPEHTPDKTGLMPYLKTLVKGL